MKQQQAGFTLIELIMVIVILGILAATALPKFYDLSTDARKSAAAGYVAALNSASAINYGGCAVKAGVATANVCVVLDSATAKCSGIKALVNPVPTVVVGAVPATTVDGTLYITTDSALTTAGTTCTVDAYGDGAAGITTDPKGNPLTFVGYATK